VFQFNLLQALAFSNLKICIL